MFAEIESANRAKAAAGAFPRARVLHLCAIDRTAKILLLPQMTFLRDQGYQVTVSSSPGPAIADVEKEGIGFWPLPVRRRVLSLSNLLVPLRLARYLRREKIDILHVHTPVASALGRVAGRLAGTPAVFYTAHGFFFHDLMPPWKWRFHVELERLLGRWTDHLFSQSREDHETAIREGIVPASAATWLGNGIDLERFQSAPAYRDSTRAELGFGPNDVVIAFTGRLDRVKGVLELLPAFAALARRHPQVRLLLIGTASPQDRDPVQRLVCRYLEDPVVQERTVLTGQTDEVPRYLGAADIFCLPSHREGVPRSIIEAMTAGLPVVACNIRGSREEVVDGETGYIVPVEEPRRLEAALERLVLRPELRRRMGAAGRARAGELYDERRVFDRLLAVYERVATERLGRPPAADTAPRPAAGAPAAGHAAQGRAR